MHIEPADLERLSTSALLQYAGNLADAFSHSDITLYGIVMSTPIEVRVIGEETAHDPQLYAVCKTFEGRQPSLAELRTLVLEELTRTFDITHFPAFNLLAVLPEGILVGDPEDLLTRKRNPNAEPLYPVKGFGEKIATVTFV